MRKAAIPLAALIVAALLFVSLAFVARSNRAQPVAVNPDVICGPEVCAQLVPFRTGMSRAAPVERGS